MQFNRRIVISGVIGITMLLAVAIVVPVVLYHKQDTLIDSDPIIVWRDEDFELYDLSGNGTEENPYIIENLRINTTTEKGIHIRDTTNYFVIRNCYVEAESVGIHIDKIASGTAIITNNTCANNDHSGILVERSEGIEITSNHCEINGKQGIAIIYSNSTTVRDNNCNHNKNGIWIENSNHNIFKNNSISVNSDVGIYVFRSDNSTIINNYVGTNKFGVFVRSSNSSTITYNLIQGNVAGGIPIDYWSELDDYIISHNRIHHNSIIGNGGIVGGFQALDGGYNNTWFDTVVLEGNFWSDYAGSGWYQITGSANSWDEYPLLTRPVIPN